MLRAILILACALPLIARAQEIPYPVVFTLQKAGESASKVEGVVCQLKMHHTREGDTRPFRIVVASPKGRIPVEVSQDGSFNLPVLPEQDRNQSKLVHDLEKGALTITFAFNVGGAISPDRGEHKSVFEVCSEIADHLRPLEDMWRVLGQAQPEWNDFQLAIVGLSIPRTKPAAGRVWVKKGDSIVTTVDLSQTGEVAVMFDQYDPKEHTLGWDVEKGAPAPPVEFVFQTGPEVRKIKNAIFLRKVDPAAPADRSKPGSSQAN